MIDNDKIKYIKTIFRKFALLSAFFSLIVNIFIMFLMRNSHNKNTRKGNIPFAKHWKCAYKKQLTESCVGLSGIHRLAETGRLPTQQKFKINTHLLNTKPYIYIYTHTHTHTHTHTYNHKQ